MKTKCGLSKDYFAILSLAPLTVIWKGMKMAIHLALGGAGGLKISI
jgi:hypothetical protein